MRWDEDDTTSSDSSRRRSSDSGSSSSWGISSNTSSTDDDEDLQAQEAPPPNSFSGLSYVLLAVVLAAAVGLALYLASEGGGENSTSESSGGGNGGGKTGTSKASGATKTATSTGRAAPAATTVGADFLASLAQKYSMTPVATSSLAMPSSAIASPSAAMSWIKDTWKPIKGDSDYISFPTDPLDSSNEEVVMQVEYEKGSYSSGKGGVMNLQMGVGFNEGFDFVKGGKLPGLYGGDPASFCTGGTGSEKCFSLRLMWRENGQGEVYAYIPQYPGQCSEDDSSSTAYCHGADGISFERGSFTFQAGVYNTVTEVAILNSDIDTANGVLALYAGETLAFELTDVVFRVNSSVQFSAFAISSFFGGSTDDYAASAECYSYFRQMRFWEGDDASTESGATVTASIVTR
ncbi:hypothetical protein JCM10213v2_002912 [Rhodosporidiobolus nylandii]